MVRSTQAPLSGAASLSVRLGRKGHQANCPVTVNSAQRYATALTVSAQLRANAPSSPPLQLCAVATYAGGSTVSQCVNGPGSAGQTALVSARLPLNSGTPLSGVVLRLVEQSKAAVDYAMDGASVTLDVFTPPPPPPPGQRWVSGYYVGYQRDLYPPDQIAFDSLTHLVVGAILPYANGTLNTTFYLDATQGPQLALDLSQRAHAAGKKALLMIGGAGVTTWASAASSQYRAALVSNLVQFARSYGYDGFDLDWEPIGSTDYPLLTALVSDLRAAYPRVILTLPVGYVNANFPTVDPFYAQIAPMLDQMNIMTYGMADAWPGWSSWHSGALTGEGASYPTSVASSVRAYVNAGVPIGKLGMGMGFFGICYGSPVTGPRQSLNGSYVKASDNDMSYTNILTRYQTGTSRQWDAAAQVPYQSFSSPTGPMGCTYISYEDEASAAAKGSWARQSGLGGTIIWTINQGYLPGAANPNGLLNAVRDAFLN